ncbi:FAD-dependent oxidoreductase [Streptomyces gamaensis]|uniref:FAD-dependent oxidoreductase n=1 Tax=Streptomyces gamaensis TaxID=1763542 RepID=A0ABW0Z5H2_9ACTN
MDSEEEGQDGQNEQDVVVIGGGPAGLALAVGLRTHGAGVTVVEREPSVKQEGRASVVWQRALETLRDLGCAERFASEGLPQRRAECYVRGRRIGTYDMGVPGTAFPHPLSIEQHATERLLAQRLAELGGDVRWGHDALAVRVGGEGAEVDVRGPDGRVATLRCRWVVGCEGAHSLVRRTLGIPFEGRARADLQAVQINAAADWRFPYAEDVTYMFYEQRVCLIASPRPGGGYRFFAFLTDPRPEETGPPGVEAMRALVAGAARDPAARLTPTAPRWVSRARFQDRLAATLRAGRALLVGDSAHLWAPVGGHGLNTGLLGAHNLGWKLGAVVRGRAHETLLDTYAHEQRRTARQVMRHMRWNVLELPPSSLTLTAMRLLGPAVLASARAADRERAVLSDLARNHRGSELCAEVPGSGGPRAGDRLPDLPVTGGARHVALHELFSYERLTLLLCPEGDTEPSADLAAVRAVTGRFAMPAEVCVVRPARERQRELPPGTLLLVRPDGHIGLRARTGDHGALERYLERWFVRTG